MVDPAMLLVSMVPAAALAGSDFAIGLAKCVHECISEIRTKSSFRRRCECWAPTHRCLFQSLSSSSSSSSPTGWQQGKMASLLNFWWQGVVHPARNLCFLTKRVNGRHLDDDDVLYDFGVFVTLIDWDVSFVFLGWSIRTCFIILLILNIFTALGLRKSLQEPHETDGPNHYVIASYPALTRMSLML